MLCYAVQRNAEEGNTVFSFLRKTSLYLLAVPALCFFLGAASNQAVLIANHDRFPVMLNDTKTAIFADKLNSEEIPSLIYHSIVKDGMIDETHCLMTPQTHLNILADVFDLGSIYSVGDFLLILADWLWAFMPFLFVFDVVRKLKAREENYYEKF